MVGVDEVDADGAMRDARLAGTRLAQLHVHPPEHLRTAEFLDANCLCHRVSFLVPGTANAAPNGGCAPSGVRAKMRILVQSGAIDKR